MPLLLVEPLEVRTVPTALGSPWPNPGTLTLSFAADGTAVGAASSDTAAPGRRQRRRRERRAAAGAGADAAGGRRVADLRGAAAPAAVVLHLLD